MVTRDAVERLAREVLADLPLSPEDREAVLAQAQRMLEVLRALDELPLEHVEPAPIYQVEPCR